MLQELKPLKTIISLQSSFHSPATKTPSYANHQRFKAVELKISGRIKGSQIALDTRAICIVQLRSSSYLS